MSVGDSFEPIFDSERVSSFSKVIGVYKQVLRFINNVRGRLANRRFDILSDIEIMRKALKLALIEDQKISFSDVFSYFSGKSTKGIPAIVSQLNIFKDKDNILRVKAKFKRWGTRDEFPILLSKSSNLSRYLIMDLHCRMGHVGKYSVLSEIRKQFWIPNVFSLSRSCLLYTSPSPRDKRQSRMPSSA